METYTKTHLRSILHALNVEIVSDTSTDFLCLCPFHNNRSTPSFAISHNKGLYVCYNPSCNAAGTILDLVKSLSQRNDFEALRFIGTMKKESEVGFDDELANLLEEKPDFVEFSKDTLDKLSEDRWNSVEACNYFLSRGINHESMDYFDLGYSEKQRMVTVPVHSPDGIAVGIVGRSIEGKSFKNSTNLPRNKTLFNLHRAKRIGSTVIVCESSFDAIRIHQSGFPNVVATLGGFLSKENIENLNKYFTKIIIMTDFDDKNKHIAQHCRKCYPNDCSGHNPGRDLGRQMIKNLPRKEFLWACYNDDVVYPHNAKDVGDMTEDEIKKCIINSIPDYEYSSRKNIY